MSETLFVMLLEAIKFKFKNVTRYLIIVLES